MALGTWKYDENQNLMNIIKILANKWEYKNQHQKNHGALKFWHKLSYL